MSCISNMGILDDYRSPKNRGLLLNASIKMIKDKYDLVMNDDVLKKIVGNVISVISNDAILLNTSIKLPELNNMTLIKIKEYIGKQIKLETVKEEDDMQENAIPIHEDTKINIKLSEDDELLNKMKELEEKRRLANILLDQNTVDDIKDADVQSAYEQAPQQMPQQAQQRTDMKIATDHIYKAISERSRKTKKTFIVNSHDRDWVNQPARNILQFNIALDLQNNVVEPCKILFPKHVKDSTPYVNMVITDGMRVQKYNFILYKNNGDWDEWTLVSEHTDQPLYFTHNNWKITFYDFLHKELKLGNDDIRITEVSKYTTDTKPDDSEAGDAGEAFACKLMLEKKHYAYFEYRLQSIRKYDDLLLKTFSNNIAKVRVVENNIETIMLSGSNLKQGDFINSKLLNCRAQYVMIFTYYSKD